MKSLHLIILMVVAVVSGRAQTLISGYYLGTNNSSVGIVLAVETNREISVLVGAVNPITGSIHAYAIGSATSKPNGTVVAKFAEGRRGRLRGHVSDDGKSIRGRVLMLTASGTRIWFVRRFRLFFVEENAATSVPFER